jgi:hypothetical protein
MRVVLADLKSNRGFVSKDTVVGGYGSRLDPFSRVTSIASYLKKQFHDVPSVHMAYLAAILSRAGHEVKWTRGDLVPGDVALVLSSLVDYKSETAWADRMRATGVKVGFVGITASKMPELFVDHCDFIFNGEPEAGVMRLAEGVVPTGIVTSEPINDPCWRAAAARNSAPTARIAFWPGIACGRLGTSWTKWSVSAIRIQIPTSSSVIRCSRNSESDASSCAMRFRPAA